MEGTLRRACFILGCLAAVWSIGFAQAAEEKPSHKKPDKGVFSIQFENDLFDGSDRWNTSNQQIGYAFRPEDTWQDTILPYWMTAPGRWIPWMTHDATQKIVAIQFGQQFFTPVSKTQIPPDPSDRPYAGWLYANLSWIVQTQATRDTLQLSLGVVGPWSLARETQDFMHDNVAHVDKFQGWDYQLPNEPAIVIAYERIWRIATGDLGENLSYDILPWAGLVVGNVYDYANAGCMARIGWHLPDDFGPQLMRPAGITSPAYTLQEAPVSFYGFFGAEGRAIARNIFLDGSTFKDSASIDKYNILAELQAGLALRYKQVELIFSQAFRTEEFIGQPCPQWFGSCRVNVAF